MAIYVFFFKAEGRRKKEEEEEGFTNSQRRRSEILKWMCFFVCVLEESFLNYTQ